MWQILLWCQMTTPKHYLLRKRSFYKGQNWDTNGRYLGRTRFVQLSRACIIGLDRQTLQKYKRRSTEPVILDLWLACEPCQMIIIKYLRNVAYLLRAGDNSTVKHRPSKHSALLNGAWPPWNVSLQCNIWCENFASYFFRRRRSEPHMALHCAHQKKGKGGNLLTVSLW